MKRMALIVLMAASAAGLIAQDLKASAGASIAFSFDGATLKYTAGTINVKAASAVKRFDFGAFLDLAYGVISMGITSDTVDTKTKVEGAGDYNDAKKNMDLLISAYGKYPIVITPGVTVFPLAGLGFGLNLSVANKDQLSDAAKAGLNYFFIGIGAGADFDVAEDIYLRPSLLLNLSPGYLNGLYKELGMTNVDNSGFAFKIGVAAGYKF